MPEDVRYETKDVRYNTKMIEHFFTCPYCGAEISMLLEPFPGRQEYIEDCEVCCNPIKISFEMEGDELRSFDSNSIDQ